MCDFPPREPAESVDAPLRNFLSQWSQPATPDKPLTDDCKAYYKDLFRAPQPAKEPTTLRVTAKEIEAPPAANDDTAFVPAATLRNDRLGEFSRADQLNRFLKSVNRQRVVIRTRKPSRNRLEIHAGDWHTYFAARDKQRDAALDAETVAELKADIAARETETRRRK